MSVRIIVTDSKYFSELKNGSNFSLNLGDFGTHLKGNLGERLKAELTVQISWRMGLSSYQITNSSTITLSSGSFITEGFAVGDTVNYTQVKVGGVSTTVTVVSISSDGLEMVTSGALLPNGAFGVDDIDILRGLTPLEGLKYKFNFIGNTANTSFISALDQTTLAYKADGIRTASPTPVVSTWNDTILGSQTGNHQVTFVQDVSDGGVIETGGVQKDPLNSIQEFKIEHEFILFPFYLDGELTNLENLLRPERIEAGLSLKHVIDFEFRSTLSNPNTAKTGQYNNVLGQTSYFDENFGDEPTQYSISGLTLTSGGSPVTGIDAASTTVVSFSVINSDGATNPFLTADPVVAYVSKLPELEEYNASTNNFTDTFIYESLRGIVDAAPNSGTIINNLDVDLISTTQIDVSFDLTYTTPQQAEIEEGDDYLIFFGVGDNALTTDLSNKSILKVNLSEYIKNQDVPGLMDVTKLEVYTHPMAFTESVTQGYTGFKGWVQDGIMWDWAFTLDRTLDAVLERFRVRLVALKTTDDTFFPLEDVEYDLSGQVITPGPPTTQQIEIDDTRGFPLADGSIFNLKTFKTGAYSAPDQAYNGQTAFKVNWQEWLALPGADTVFYDPSEPNNGLNQKASQYSLKSGYEIRFIIDADVSVNGASTTNYIFKSPDAVCLDFEEQDGTPISWTSVKETFDLSGANLNQEILTNEDTRVAFTFSPSAAPGIASLYWGIVRIEEVNQPGVAICELSSLNFRPSKNNNILKPLSGDTEASLTICAGDVCLECLVDYTKLDPAKSYNVYGRLGLVDQTPVVVPTIFRELSIDFDDNANFVVFQQSEAMANATLTDAIFQLLDASGDIVWKSDATNLGGDRSDWSGALTYANFAALAVDLAANSSLYIYCEVNETNYPIILKEGLIITYEAIGAAVSPSSFTLNFDTTRIDLEQIRWFNQKVDISLQSSNAKVAKIHYALRVVGTPNGEYTEYLGSDASGLTALNAAILLLADNTKYGVHIYCEATGTAGALTATFDVDYLQVGSDDYEVELQAGLNTVNDQRPFTDNIGSGVPEAVGFFGEPNIATSTNVTCLDIGSARNALFDIQNDNSFTLDFWIDYTVAGTGASPTLLWNRGGYGGGDQFPTSNGLQTGIGTFGIAANLHHNTTTRMSRNSPYNWQRDHRYHIVITYQPVKTGGFYRASGFEFYVNGYKIEDTAGIREDIPTDGTTRTDAIEAVTSTQGLNYVKPLTYQGAPVDRGALGSPEIINIQGRDTLKSTHRMRIWDVALTDEEVYQLYKQGLMTGGSIPQSGNLLDNFDFSNPNLISYTIPNSGSGVDGQLVKNDLGNPWSTIVADSGILNWD